MSYLKHEEGYATLHIMTGSSFEDDFPHYWRGRYPRAGEVKTSQPWSARMSRERALREPYIEANPYALRSLLVTDHDGGEAEHIAGARGLPAPSYVALNALTRSGHIVYALSSPVCMTNSARIKPMRLLARIESGLTHVLGGDLSYGTSTGANLTKNPLHSDHITAWGGSGTAYELRDLATALDQVGALPRFTDRQSITHSTIGRNCALFDLVRDWAYRAILRHHTEGLEAWEVLVAAYAWDRNLTQIGSEFSRGPLEAGECAMIARSVARWTWRKFEQNGGLEYLRAKQSYRGKQPKTISDKLRAANTAHGFQTTEGMTAARKELGR